MGSGPNPCDDILRELYHFLHGELTETRRVSIRVHLEACSSCLEVFDFEAELRTVIASRCHERVPDTLRARIAGLLQLPEL